jgi:DNA-binding response OmpR family regulator
LAFVRRVRDPETGPHAFARIVMMSRCTKCRQVLAARDAGVDALLVKPLSRAGLLAGIRAVIDNPRPFSRTEGYFGPDRRRKQIGHDGPERRKGEETIVRAELGETENGTADTHSQPTPRMAAQGPHDIRATLQR